MSAINEWGELFAKLNFGSKGNITQEAKEVVVETEPVAPTPVDLPHPVVEVSESESEPINREEWEKLSEQQGICEETVAVLKDKLVSLASVCDPRQKPKGIATILTHLNGVTSCTAATKALVDYYLEVNAAHALQNVEKCNLKFEANNTYQDLQSRKAILQENLDLLEKMIVEGEERFVLNVRTQTIKEHTLRLSIEAKRQAMAFSNVVGVHPSPDGSLALLKRFAERNDKKEMDSIDYTLNMAETAMVLVEDAPAMLTALKNDDTDAIVCLQKKLIDYIFDMK